MFHNYKGSALKRKWLKNIFRSAYAGMIIVVSCVFEDTIAKILGITGALACTPVAFTLPALFHLKLIARRPCEKLLDWIYIGLSLFILVFATSFNVYDVVRFFQKNN